MAQVSIRDDIIARTPRAAPLAVNALKIAIATATAIVSRTMPLRVTALQASVIIAPRVPAAAFVHPRPRFYRDSVLLERIRLAAGFLERAQSTRPTGS